VRRRGVRTAIWRIAVIACLVASGTAIVPAAPVAAASDRLPDLRSARIRDLRIVRTSSGRKLLRFTSEILNYGAGPFEIRGNRPTTSVPFDIDQIVYRSDGSIRRVQTNATMVFAGDGHEHYHVRRMMSYHLWSTRGTLRDRKIGFCFFDTNARYLSLPGAPRSARYRESGCGGRTARSTRSGISVGWGDRYPWNFAYQWIDITGLPSGTYTLRSAVDLFGTFVESSETNNCSYLQVSISGSTVRVLSSGTTCIDDYSPTPYADDVRWALEADLRAGCDPLLFCTYNPTLREQLAVFVSRLLNLPPTDEDRFDDDDGTPYEAHINRVARAGLMSGCGVRRFCPTGKVTRALTALTLYRALGLPPSETDHFTDDDGTASEPAINAVADAGFIDPCGDLRFCPTAIVLRGEMSRVLRRAFEPAA
jgi:hypothetical protein